MLSMKKFIKLYYKLLVVDIVDYKWFWFCYIYCKI